MATKLPRKSSIKNRISSYLTPAATLRPVRYLTLRPLYAGRFQIDSVDRLAGGHKEPVLLAATKADIGTDLW